MRQKILAIILVLLLAGGTVGCMGGLGKTSVGIGTGDGGGSNGTDAGSTGTEGANTEGAGAADLKSDVHGDESLLTLDGSNTNRFLSLYGIMKTDTGFYYMNDSSDLFMNLHYYDIGSAQNIYLCSRPECSHTGEESCTATSRKYHVNNLCMYGGKLYLNVTETNDTQAMFKLLRVEPDGSGLTELTTFSTIDAMTGNSYLIAGMAREDSEMQKNMLCHRGWAVLTYQYESLSDSGLRYYGTVMYNLVTGESVLLPEMDSNEGAGQNSFSCYGDYIYYNTRYKKGKKQRLSRFNVKDGTVEEIAFSNSYNGVYVVADDDTIFYNDDFANLNEYRISTGISKSRDKFYRRVVEIPVNDEAGEPVTLDDGTPEVIEIREDIQVYSLARYKDYILVPSTVEFGDCSHHFGIGITKDDFDFYEIYLEMYSAKLFVYDLQMNLISEILLENQRPWYSGPEDESATVAEIESGWFSLAIVDDVLYKQENDHVEACPMEDVLAGKVHFENVFVREFGVDEKLLW